MNPLLKSECYVMLAYFEMSKGSRNDMYQYIRNVDSLLKPMLDEALDPLSNQILSVSLEYFKLLSKCPYRR